MPLAQKFNYPKSENELRITLDLLYASTKKMVNDGKPPAFKGLLEIIQSDVVILTAIHNIKNNHGKNTPGSDGWVMNDILQKQYDEVLELVKNQLVQYNPQPVRRVYIPKPGKSEKRPLGIPAVVDRIVQECVRIVIEPILETQFFKHSYGFRPMRDAQQAIARLTDVAHKTGYSWIVEGDISKFFDNVDHRIMLKQLWNMGIKDQRVLMIIKAMLKAGVMEEFAVNPMGTPQGGIISPLLANAYLDKMDKWITREWERKMVRGKIARTDILLNAKKSQGLKPAYLIRYADDWVLLTNTKENAEKWKYRIGKYLETNLKLTLSEEKTVITNIKKHPVQFLGYSFKMVKGKSRTGYLPRTRPNEERLETKVKEIHKQIKKIRRIPDKSKTVCEINLINSQIRGIINYYKATTWVNIDLRRYAETLAYAGYKTLLRHGVKWTPANEVDNLISVHQEYTKQIPAIEYEGKLIGITSMKFCRFNRPHLKTQEETPYTEEGRKLYFNRSLKKPLLARMDIELNEHLMRIMVMSRQTGHGRKYNFEYFLNRAYAVNRDKGKCRICGLPIPFDLLEVHHIKNKLPLDKINKVNNLASLHRQCHEKIDDGNDYSHLDAKQWAKIQRFREKLNME